MLRLKPGLDNKQGVAEGSTGSSSATSSPHVNGWRLDPVMASGPITKAGFQLLVHRKVHLQTPKSTLTLAALTVDYFLGAGDSGSIATEPCHAIALLVDRQT